LKIFLSSTFLDLAASRAEIVTWLTGVFGADMVVMETFGSDAVPPDITSVRRVRECDIFIGIYARRYGSVDPTSGKSITELELDEARNAFSSGIIRTILLYVLQPDAKWPATLVEPGPEALSKLERLTKKIRQYTFTFYNRTEQLPFFIVRDVHREVLSTPQGTRRLRALLIPPRVTLTHPLGMEFLTSAEASYLAGRDKQVGELVELLEQNEISLLLGDSGVGKTSLIHAGLIPAAARKWRTVYTRPLGLPESDIVSQLQTSLFEGMERYKGPIAPLVAEAVAALGGQTLLLIIDQFEDVLAAREIREVDQLIEGLRRIRNSGLAAVRVLICYRADLEGRLGELWQKITGPPQGLPRLYLTGITANSALATIEKSTRDLCVSLELSFEDKSTVEQDLLVASEAANCDQIYPPYVQIVIDHIWSTAHSGTGKYSVSDYTAASRIQGIVGTYLGRLLNYAKDSKGEAQAVLVTLVRSYGAKRQVTLQDVASETGRDEILCEGVLEKLIDLRLVRHIGNFYEITHDFIARKVLYELVDSDEITFKRFRELFASKAAAFNTTRSLLTTEELLMLYTYRDRVIPNDLELRLLLASWLNNKGPALYWLRGSEPKQIALWLQTEGDKTTERDASPAMGILLKRSLTGGEIDNEDYLKLRGFQLSAELAGLIIDSCQTIPEKVLIHGLRHRRAEVRNAALEAVAKQISDNNWLWINRLRNSSSTALRRAYEEIVFDDRVSIPKLEYQNCRPMREFAILKALASPHRSKAETGLVYASARKLRLPKRTRLFSKSLYLWRTGKINAVISASDKLSADDCSAWLSAARGEISDESFSLLLKKYVEWNNTEKGTTPALAGKANALARAICRLANEGRVDAIASVLESIPLRWSSRSLVAAILRCGDTDHVRFVLTKIGDADRNIDYWNHTELGSIVEERMSKNAAGLSDFLISISSTPEFWESKHGEERKKTNRADLLPLKNLSNRPLYVRLAAYAMIGSSAKSDEPLLLRLAMHPYGLIARSAARRLVKFSGNALFGALTALIVDRISSGKTGSISAALVQAELEYYGLMPRNIFIARC
jgi:hypothetical protein